MPLSRQRIPAREEEVEILIEIVDAAKVEQRG
jgi:hypothetical protein